MVLQCKTSVFVQLVTFKVFGVCVLRRSEIARVKLMKYARERARKKGGQKGQTSDFSSKSKTVLKETSCWPPSKLKDLAPL